MTISGPKEEQMNFLGVIVWIVWSQVVVSSTGLSHHFDDNNPFAIWCQAQQPGLRHNYSTIENSVGTKLNILRCGHFIGAEIANETPKKFEPVVGFGKIHYYQQIVMDSFIYLQGIGREFGKDTVVLDYGADISGKPLNYLVSKFGIKAVGYNVFGFYDRNRLELFDYPHEDISMVLGKIGESLPFKYGSFHMVLSANIMEHVNDYAHYLQNAIHVLKHKGLLYIIWQPTYYGYLGHHVHPDMLQEWWESFNCGDSSNISNWENFIGPFDHLLKSPIQLKYELKQGLLGTCDRLVENIVHYMHHSQDLNRMLYEDVIMYLKKSEDVEILLMEFQSFEVDDITLKELQEKFWDRDYGVRQLKILARKL
eukprot:TRINITY_DN1464_c0_g1_i1.p1 TRINITY_DN1464_c0_g1~~TRINITY_DN1464_c0_g1_i1.p1  ORF type:complete len:367 (+),score=19.97 TRINITY_DN1464_c0_g1_i1:80-1180(+)